MALDNTQLVNAWRTGVRGGRPSSRTFYLHNSESLALQGVTSSICNLHRKINLKECSGKRLTFFNLF